MNYDLLYKEINTMYKVEDNWSCYHVWDMVDDYVRECRHCKRRKEIFSSSACTSEEFKKLFPTLDMNKESK